MAFYSRRGNWGYNPYKRWKTSSSNKRYKGQMKAAKQVKDSMSMNIKCNVTFSASYDATKDMGGTAINIYELLRQNPQFQNFNKLYDQVKIGGIRCKLNVIDALISVANANEVKSINVAVAWDRTGLSREQVKFFDSTPEEIARIDWDTSGAHSFCPKIGKGICNATGVDKSTLNSYQRWNKNMNLFPSTLEEKSQYLSTSNFEDVIANYSYETGLYYVNESNDSTPITELFNSANPCLPFESPSCKWKPTLLVGVFRSEYNNTSKAIDQFVQTNNVLFNGEFSIDVTFRNMKTYT